MDFVDFSAHPSSRFFCSVDKGKAGRVCGSVHLSPELILRSASISHLPYSKCCSRLQCRWNVFSHPSHGHEYNWTSVKSSTGSVSIAGTLCCSLVCWVHFFIEEWTSAKFPEENEQFWKDAFCTRVLSTERGKLINIKIQYTLIERQFNPRF